MITKTGTLILSGALAAGLGLLAGGANAQTRAPAASSERQAQEAACGGDAQRLCGPYIPDEQKIAACLKANKAKLTPACAKIIP